MDYLQRSKPAMYKAIYTHCMYGGSTISPWDSSSPETGYVIGRPDLGESLLVEQCYNPDMEILNLPSIEVPRQQFVAELAIAWTIKSRDIARMKQHKLKKNMYVGTWNNDSGHCIVMISQNIQDKYKALERAKKLNERMVWDIKNNRHINV